MSEKISEKKELSNLQLSILNEIGGYLRKSLKKTNFTITNNNITIRDNESFYLIIEIIENILNTLMIDNYVINEINIFNKKNIIINYKEREINMYIKIIFEEQILDYFQNTINKFINKIEKILGLKK